MVITGRSCVLELNLLSATPYLNALGVRSFNSFHAFFVEFAKPICLVYLARISTPLDATANSTKAISVGLNVADRLDHWNLSIEAYVERISPSLVTPIVDIRRTDPGIFARDLDRSLSWASELRPHDYNGVFARDYSHLQVFDMTEATIP